MTKTILVVEDDLDYQTQLRMQLENLGFEVMTAESVPQARARVDQQRPDLAIVDLMLEHLDDGFVAAYHLKRLTPPIPVILISAVVAQTGIAFDAKTDEERSWVKADVLLHKPLRFETLQQEISQLLPA